MIVLMFVVGAVIALAGIGTIMVCEWLDYKDDIYWNQKKEKAEEKTNESQRDALLTVADDMDS